MPKAFLHFISALSHNFCGATACNATHGIARPFCPSVRLSVKRVDCDKTKETCANIFIQCVWWDVKALLNQSINHMKDHSF